MISSEKVTEIFLDCMYKKDELIDGKPIIEPINIEGINVTIGFNPESVKRNTKVIKSFIDELPDSFKEGWTFLALCNTKDGHQWTGLHRVCQELMLLGMAAGYMEYCNPEELQGSLPCGVPYLRIIEKEDNDA